MKKTYLIPSIAPMSMSTEQMLAGSVTGGNGIGYGGIDTEGDKDPDVKGNPFGENIFE